MDDLAAVCSGYPLVSSKLMKMLGFKGYLPLPFSPTPRSKRELGQPLLSCQRAKLRGRSKTENWDSPLIFMFSFLLIGLHYDIRICLISIEKLQKVIVQHFKAFF